ncbi:MAG: hypothetical protein J0G30_08845 [Actinomycetales bacterium]|nr:hypothetical protein [Actinomycetales bacterium]
MTEHGTAHLPTRLGAAGAGLALAALLAACGTAGPASTGSPSPSPTPTVSTSPSPAPTPTPVSIAIPDCEQLLPLATARTIFSPSTEYLGEVSLSGSGFVLGSDAATTAASAADPYRGCSWGIPNSDGVFWLYVGVLDSAEVAALEAGLTADGFTSATTGTVTGYDQLGSTEVSDWAATHLVTGGAWIACEGPAASVTGQATGAALDAMRAANPSAGL